MAIFRELEDLLNARGRRVLAGTHPLCRAFDEPGRRFVAAADLVDARKAARLRDTIANALGPHLGEMARPIPPQTLTRMRRNYGELLPKTGRVLTAYLDSPRERAWRAAEKLGLIALLRSASLRAFVEAIGGRSLNAKCGMQALCYRPGDYAGPHNDHHPEDSEARAGYTDFHLTLGTPGVARQLLVYARRGHFSEVVDVSTLGGITVYRLPFWHFTTPLEGRPESRRWVLLSTFLDA